MQTNHMIQAGKRRVKDSIYEFQQLNRVPNFIIEMILQDILLEVKELRMSEMLVESEMIPDESEGEKTNGDTDDPSDNPDALRRGS